MSGKDKIIVIITIIILICFYILICIASRHDSCNVVAYKLKLMPSGKGMTYIDTQCLDGYTIENNKTGNKLIIN